MKFIKKKYNINTKKLDLESLLRDHDIDLNEPISKDKKTLIHLLILEEDLENLELILSLPKDGFKTKCKPDMNIVDDSWGWTPLITAINQGPKGFVPGIHALLRAGADPYLEIASDHDENAVYTPA